MQNMEEHVHDILVDDESKGFHQSPSTTLERFSTTIEEKNFSAVTSDYDSLPTYPVVCFLSLDEFSQHRSDNLFEQRPHFHEHHLTMRPATQLISFDGCPNDPYHPTSMPIYQTVCKCFENDH